MPLNTEKLFTYIGTAANLVTANEVIADNEWCIESDTGRVKQGNGVTNYVSLPYVTGSPVIRTTTANSDTITQADNGKIIRSDNLAGQDLTLTPPITAGFTCVIRQAGVGAVAILGDSGVSLLNRQSFTSTAGQHAVVSLICDTDDEVVLAGDAA